MRKLVLIFLLAAPLGGSAQSLVTVSPQQCVWREGDDVTWAAPNLDEPGWKPYADWKLNPNEPRIWVRCEADFTSLTNTTRPALQVNQLGAYQLYLNGRPIGSSGNIASGAYSENYIETFPIATGDLAPGANQLAIRITYRETGQTDRLQIVAGNETQLRNQHDHKVLNGALTFLIVGVWYVVIGVVGFMLLGLYLADRSRLEFLLLAIICWCLAVIRLGDFCNYALVPISSVVFNPVYAAGQFIYLSYLFFMFRLGRKRVPWWYLTLCVVYSSYWLGLFVAVFLPPDASLHLEEMLDRVAPYGVAIALVVVLSPFYVFWPWNRIAERMRPVVACCMLYAAADAFWLSAVLASKTTATGAAFFHRWSVTMLETRVTATASVIVALLALLVWDQRHAMRERALLAGEMASAREIQQYLIPEKLPPTPGLAIESVYHPSREVGGDFFQVLPDERDGSTLVVVGDVAGKGLKAGMLSALIVGAIRTAFKFTSEPSEILALLNDRLQGRGLVTCMALRIRADGSAELANAGHLPPYINGKELAVEGALPLGAVPGIAFRSMRFQLAPREVMLLISDGVVEARNATGELFGFERTQEISGQSAERVAEAAQRFGQEDDITVLTLSLVPVAVVNA